MGRSYGEAVAALNTLQSNFSVVDAIRKSGRGMNKQAIPEMIDWCQRTGYEPSNFNRLNCIHIAGTKGKGSTSAFISSILAQYLPSASQPRPLFRKIGLYTSPHLRFVRERIQINNEPLSEGMFAKYFFEVWDRLEDTASRRGLPTDVTAKPVYFRFLTLMAFHTFLSEGVDTAVIECGIGGEYDSTNIIEKPTVTGITSLGIDHTAMLGNTTEEIAWHKAGIMKSGASAFTSPQPTGALEVLKNRALEKGVTLEMVERNPEVDSIQLGLAADFQKTNASLAVSVASAHLNALGMSTTRLSPLPAEFVKGLEEVRWAGRCEIRRSKNIAWHIDGCHTLESIKVAGIWFAQQIRSQSSSLRQPTRILLFNQQTRDADTLARTLHETLATALDDDRPFTHAVFCTNTTFKDAGFKPDLISLNSDSEAVQKLEVQHRLADTWKAIDPRTKVEVKQTIEEAIGWVKSIAATEQEEVVALVTGSVHLVGGFLEVFETTDQ